MFDPWSPHASTLREKLMEHVFLGELLRALLRAGRRCEVLRAETDTSGYDLAIEVEGMLRHVQLKAMRSDGMRRKVDLHLGLAAKPAGCVVWMLVDPASFATEGFYWFGGAPGQPLPELGSKIARHSRPNGDQKKAERPELRTVGRGRFERIQTIDQLVLRLFG